MKNAVRWIAAIATALFVAGVVWLWSGSRDAFVGNFEHQLSKRFPRSLVLSREGTRLECVLGGRLVTLKLSAVYAAWKHQPARRKVLISHYLAGLEHAADPGRFELLAARVFPLLRRADSPLRHCFPYDRLTNRPFGRDLEVIYCVEFPDRITMIDDSLLSVWKVNLEDLHSRSLANLLERTREPQPGYGPAGLYAFSQNDGYDAARLLIVREVWNRMGRGSGTVYAAAPHRDALYILDTGGLQDAGRDLEWLKNATGRLYRSSRDKLWPEVLAIGP